MRGSAGRPSRKSPRRGRVAALLAAAFCIVPSVPVVAGSTGPTGRTVARATPVDPAAPWLVAPGVLFNPTSGRRVIVGDPTGDHGQATPGTDPRARAQQESSAAARGSGGGGRKNDPFDPRLAGERRSVFYPAAEAHDGAGRFDRLAGGMCDGLTGRDVAVAPYGVQVDSAGRVFWMDLNDNAHQKGLAYIRVLDTDGRVRTLGNASGPLTGRFFRDQGASLTASRIVPDDRGGVYFFFDGQFTGIQWGGFATTAGDDVPKYTVIGHLDRDGRQRFVAGTSPTRGYSSNFREDALEYRDRYPYEQAAFASISAMTRDVAGRLYVGDGPAPHNSPHSAGASPFRQSADGEMDSDEAELPSPGTTTQNVIRVLNTTSRPMVLYKGTDSEMTIPPGTVDTIAGSRDDGGVALGGGDDDPRPPVGGAPEPPRQVDARQIALGLVSDVKVRPDGVIELIELKESSSRLLAINTTDKPRLVHGVRVRPAQIAYIAGGSNGYVGDGGPAADARFNIAMYYNWYYGALSLGSDGSAYIADTLNSRIRRIDDRGRVTTVAGTGKSATGRDGVAATATELSRPMGVATTRRGAVVIADWGGSRIREVTRGGTIRTLAGTGSPSVCGAGTKAVGASFGAGAGFGAIHDVARDHKGNTYIADVNAGTVSRIGRDGIARVVVGRPRTCEVVSHPETVGFGECSPPAPAGDGGPADKAILQAPGYLLVDRYDNLYISDGTSVRYVNFGRDITVHDTRVRAGTIATLFSVEPREVVGEIAPDEIGGNQVDSRPVKYRVLVGLTGLALDEAGTLYIADAAHNLVHALNWCGDRQVVAGNGSVVPGNNDSGAPNGDGGPATAAPVAPVGLAWDGRRKLLFIASPHEARVRVVNRSTAVARVNGAGLAAGAITTFAGGAPCPELALVPGVDGPTANNLGRCSYGDGNRARSVAFAGPASVAVRPGGRVFIGDLLLNQIRVVETDGRVGTLAGVTPDVLEFAAPEAGYTSGEAYATQGAETRQWVLGGVCGEGGRSYFACLGGLVSLQLDRAGNLLTAEALASRAHVIRDAVRAPLRPLNLYGVAPGAHIKFSLTRLRPATGHGTYDPSAAVDVDGSLLVLAPTARDDSTPTGCNLWRVVPGTDRRRDEARFVANTDLAETLGDVVPPVGRSTSCALTTHRGRSDLPPDGVAARLSFASSIEQRVAGVPVALSVRAGSSRDNGQTFLASNLALVPAPSISVRSPQISAFDGDTAFDVLLRRQRDEPGDADPWPRDRAWCRRGAVRTPRHAVPDIAGRHSQPAG